MLLVHETGKAYLLDIDEVGENWLPKSQVEYGSGSAEVTIPMWIVENWYDD